VIVADAALLGLVVDGERGLGREEMVVVEPVVEDRGSPDGIPAEFAGFYGRTVSGVTRTVFRMAGSWELARDVVQDAYEKMLHQWPVRQWNDDASNRGYVIRTAHNRLVDLFRRGRLKTIDSEGLDVAYHEPGYAAVDRQDVRPTVIKFLDSQPFMRRSVATLYFLEEMAYRDIAQLLGIAESTARTHVERVRVGLRPLLSHHLTHDGGE
jgi:RNA polymerase sigma factor (sigma-70 family)